AFQATEHLIANKYRRIAMLNIGPDVHFASQRSAGYLDALKQNRLTYGTALVRLCRPSTGEALKDCVRAGIQSLLELTDPPDALFTATDQLSTLSLSVLHAMRRRIPSDIALIGFSNTELADVLTPPLSTLHQPALEIGRLAAEKLIGLITHKGVPEGYETVRLPARLDIRDSSVPCVRKKAIG